jgi:polyisoprenoid-binding protein YceI
MMSTPATTQLEGSTNATGLWVLDPARSSVEFQVRHFYGLITVKGRFDRYGGVLALGESPSAELTIEADSIDTGNAKRDKHLRSSDFFHVEANPHVRFVSEDVTLDGEQLRVRGRLHAAGGQIPLEIDANLREVDGEVEIDATAHVAQRELGMTWNPLRLARSPTKLLVRGRLVRDAGGAR